VPFKYVGNSFSCIFHRPSCPFGQCISEHHLRFFARRFNAIDAGYRPCEYCLPKTWTAVHAVLIGQQSQRAKPEVVP
jgi:methylphosphotriester-DNA--protein-cysteine methyltransferase